MAEAQRLEAAFDLAMAERDAAAAVNAVLELDRALVEWSADTTQSDEPDRVRATLRSMIVRLGAGRRARAPRSPPGHGTAGRGGPDGEGGGQGGRGLAGRGPDARRAGRRRRGGAGHVRRPDVDVDRARLSRAGPTRTAVDGWRNRVVLLLTCSALSHQEPSPLTSQPPSSSGLGHHPFKVAARVRIPLGVRSSHHGPVVQFGVHAGLSSRRSRVQIPSGPPCRLRAPRSGSSVGRARA